MNTKTAAIVFALSFFAFGILGYFSNPIVGTSPHAFFYLEKSHNIVHLASGAFLLIGALAAPRSAGVFLMIFGIIYGGLGIYGLATIGKAETQNLLGFLPINKQVNYGHTILGTAIFITGFLKPGR